MAAITKKTAAFFAHESAFQTHFNSLTKHLNDPLYLNFLLEDATASK
jgi:hypothetical protein